ncbi:protein of unknown function [endosymbiont DhMRE of Dentiscutata heterogama]|uniref:hypothetical protein n=1 Tax=endosymbiont DhMRE of Dentiscutata heterogama TaxID=1609546 RepID=UPI000629DBB4|nr:hypothetical protein [endosymbiont DhMRE of Dentiscutata heterogama]CFW93351.1 protein of unknown function [endosymbiont DhMRE of Dentiscutata heterogama]
MTGDTKKIIEQLRQKLINYQKELNTLGKQFLKAKNGNKQDIASKEKELEEWRKKLELCQQEKNNLKQELRDKVKELERSELTNGEKQTKINQILTKHSEELEAVDKLLEEERTQYRSLRDKLIEKLCEPCSTCPEKEKAKGYLEQKIVWLLGIIVIMLFFFLIFHVWFIR